MRFHVFTLLPFALILLSHHSRTMDPSPLAAFSSEWNDPKYAVCNTAANIGWLTEEEKRVIYIINLVHANPKLFASSVVKAYPDLMNKARIKTIPEYASLLDTLTQLRQLPLLYPDSLCYESAKCHAIYSGQTGYIGHERKSSECKAKKHHMGEGCQYGYKDALSIVMALLIDEGVPGHGHRFLCLNEYKRIGVSIQPHKEYGHNTVIDFY